MKRIIMVVVLGLFVTPSAFADKATQEEIIVKVKEAATLIANSGQDVAPKMKDTPLLSGFAQDPIQGITIPFGSIADEELDLGHLHPPVPQERPELPSYGHVAFFC